MKSIDANTFPFVSVMLGCSSLNAILSLDVSLAFSFRWENASSGVGSLIIPVNRDLIKRCIAWQLLINSPVCDFRWSLIRRFFRLNFDKQQPSLTVCAENTRVPLHDNCKWCCVVNTIISRSTNLRYWPQNIKSSLLIE